MVSGGGPDENDARRSAGLGELGAFGQKPVSRVNRVDARLDGDAHDVLDVEIRLDRTLALADEIALVGLGPMQREAVLARMNRHGANAELGGRAHHADGDFAAIRDEHTLDRGRLWEWFHLLLMIALGRISGQRRHSMFGLAIHGGAGTLPRADMSAESEARYRAGLSEALAAGFAVLERGGSSLEAVTRAVVALEDYPLFNAGRGAVFTRDGQNELDASIMDGATRRAGAVCGLAHVKNPIELARAVMEHSEYVMLSGPAPRSSPLPAGFALVPRSYFYTEARWRQLERIRSGEAGLSPLTISHLGTVGAVAADAAGRLAAATSTGGMTGKRFGRIGDSPIIGAGTYADDRFCAVSATGHGEVFIRRPSPTTSARGSASASAPSPRPCAKWCSRSSPRKAARAASSRSTAKDASSWSSTPRECFARAASRARRR